MPAAKKPAPRHGAPIAIGTGLERGLYAIRLLRDAPISTAELARTLDLSRESVDEILLAIRRADLPLTSVRHGREVRHSLPKETLARVLP